MWLQEGEFWTRFALPVAGTAALGGALIVTADKEYRESVQKYVPHPVVFALGWTILYILLAYVFYENWLEYDTTYVLFVAILVLNIVWIVAFYTMQNQKAGMVAILLNLYAGLFAFAVLNSNTDTASTWYLAAYVGWLAYASYLNWDVLAHEQLKT